MLRGIRADGAVGRETKREVGYHNTCPGLVGFIVDIGRYPFFSINMGQWDGNVAAKKNSGKKNLDALMEVCSALGVF